MKLIPAYLFLTITPPAFNSGVGKSCSSLSACASPVSLTTAAYDGMKVLCEMVYIVKKRYGYWL